MSAQPSHEGVAPLRARQLHVVLTPGRASIQAVALRGSALSIGRAGSAGLGLALPDPEVSRAHAVVERDASGVDVIVDQGSRNGLRVNGERTSRAALSHGAVIRLGRSLLVYSDDILPVSFQWTREREGLVGSSASMHVVRGAIERMARAPGAVLVAGETGVGKECVARDLHARSGRAGPLLPVNCAALPETLAESELFGHAASAFTGASGPTKGLFRAAEGGTLFLDEIGELALPVQAKLLRVLAESEIRAVGATEPRRVDVRVIAATHRSLAADVEAGRFRGDLYARLGGLTIDVPPLRARREDVLRLADALLRRANRRLRMSTSAAEALLLHEWPRNVRELDAAMLSAALQLEDGALLGREHLPPAILADLPPELRDARAASEMPERPPAEQVVALLAPADQAPGAEALRLVLTRHGGNVSKVAEHFGCDRKQVYRWMARDNLDVSEFRDR